MTKRNPVSSKQNIWYDAEQVDNTDLSTEQDYNDVIQSGIISNHVGTGILPDILIQNVLFDSALASGFLDGVPVYIQTQPSDTNYGNQLEISLEDSKVAGRKAVKLAVIGLDFQSNLQYEVFYFRTNETQVSKKHFASILVMLFNDFVGDTDLSLNLGGRIVIRESKPMTLSRNTVMVSQEVEPNLFFRDFFVDGFASVTSLLESALPLYNVDDLNIITTELDNKTLLSGDVTSQVGQKFLATTNNIQKASLLLSVRNLNNGEELDLTWNGDIVVSIYPLQSTVESSDIAPNLAIDFSPSNIPVAQVSFNYASLLASGTLLDSVPQPVDFVFSNSPVAGGNVLIAGQYYVLAIKRSGSANKCDILVASGSDQTTDSRITMFTGTLWVDLPDQDLWFKIYTDAAKVSDGQAYESGHGITIPKTTINDSLATVDYSYEGFQFYGNDIFRAVVSASVEKTVPIPDQRTGQPVLSRKEFIPSVELLNTIDITNLEVASDPLLIGAISDKNRKFFDSISSLIASKLHSATMVDDELLIRIIDDATDSVRYDTTVTALMSNLLNGDFAGAKLFPNTGSPSIYYKVASAKLFSGILGDVNGDGQIDSDDLDLLNSYLDYDLNVGLPVNSVLTTDGSITTFVNGYSAYKQAFSGMTGIEFQLVNPETGVIIDAGSDGVMVANPSDERLAAFTSVSATFPTVGVSDYKLVLFTPLNLENQGGFDITGLDELTNTLTIRKVVLNSETVMQMMRADIDGDFHVTSNDGYLLDSYIERFELTSSPTPPYPAPTSNAYDKIGERFSILSFKVEKFVDRNDDYTSVTSGRSAVVHTAPDLFLNDGYFTSHNFYTYPANVSIEKQLSWEESLVVTNSRPRLVPSTFNTSTGFVEYLCANPGVTEDVYEEKPTFDSGRVDFFTPDNIIIGQGGQLKNPDGYYYKVDFEVGTIILEIPDGLYGTEKTLNIMDDFISDYTGDGRTRLGFPSMKFADCSLVTTECLTNDQVRFSVAVQSFSPNTNGLSDEGYYGAIVDGKIGLSIDYSTGLLTLNFTNLYQDTVLKTLSTKIQIHVYLKKAGFNNQTLFVDSTKVQNILRLTSIFSGSAEGGPSALIDLTSDVSGVLPIIHGGTGLSTVGANGKVLTSNGTSVSYQFLYDLPTVINITTGVTDANKIIKTDAAGFLDPTFMYKNPLYVYGTAGSFTNATATVVTIGAFVFRFDKIIETDISTIKFEAIIKTSNAVNVSTIKLYNVNTASYILINGVADTLTTTATAATLVTSGDLKLLLSSGATDYLYEVHLLLDPGAAELATCNMARLAVTYTNV